MSVKQAKREIDSPEFTDWIAYDRLEPIGPERILDAMALVCCVVMAAQGHEKSKGKPFELSDFMLQYGKEAKSRQQSPQEMIAKLTQFAQFQNALVDKGQSNG